MELFNEGVIATLLKKLSFGKIKRELRKYEKLDDDPEIKGLLDTIKYHSEELESRLVNWCKDPKNADHPLCGGSGGRSKVKSIKW